MAETASSATRIELVIKRVFRAPRELVWAAWTEREHVLNWLGPAEFTALDFKMEGAAGGSWSGRMKSPEGTEYGNQGTVCEASEPERLVFTFAWVDEDGNPGREMLVTITLEEHPEGTEMTFHQAEFESADDRDGHRGGWSQSFDKLESYLERVAQMGG